MISGLAERGLWNSVAYCASQGAALQLTRALALEWSQKALNVTPNVISVSPYRLRLKVYMHQGSPEKIIPELEEVSRQIPNSL